MFATTEKKGKSEIDKLDEEKVAILDKLLEYLGITTTQQKIIFKPV